MKRMILALYGIAVVVAALHSVREARAGDDGSVRIDSRLSGYSASATRR